MTRKMGEEGFSWFVGVVVDVDDPDMLGRVKVKAFNHHDDLDKEDLPWATPLNAFVSASLNGVGISPTGILEDSWVVGFWMDGRDGNYPMILGTIAKLNGEDQDKSDVSKLAREEQSLLKERVGPEPESAYDAKYPHNKVYTTPFGHAIEVDDTPDHERIHVYHGSGSYQEINQDGRWVRKVVDNDFEIVVNDKTIYIGGSANVVIKGDATMAVDGDIDMSAGGTITIAAGEDVYITGSTINLN